METAKGRLEYVLSLGATPFAMYYRDTNGMTNIPLEWKDLIRYYSRPALMFSKNTPAPQLKPPARAGTESGGDKLRGERGEDRRGS